MIHSKAFTFIAAALLVASCATPSKINYLRDMEVGKVYDAIPVPAIKLQSQDRIAIRVMAEEPALIVPFTDASSPVLGSGAGLYTVDTQGYIEFPVLGRLYVSGQTMEEVRDEIEAKIKQKGYIKEPEVSVALDNFTVTVIGRTGQSVLEVKDNSINIFQVVANSGLDPIEARIKDVVVVRTEDGKRCSYKLDLRSKDVFDSPVYYLKQNDIVYFKQRGGHMMPSGEAFMSILGTALSFITSTVYLYWWINVR